MADYRTTLVGPHTTARLIALGSQGQSCVVPRRSIDHPRMLPLKERGKAWRRCLGMAALAVTFGACYDHRITQAILERNRRAREAEGAKIQAARVSAPRGGMRRGRLRFYVARAFREQHRDWRHAISNLVDAANGVLGPNFAVQLELEAMSEWEPSCSSARMDGCLVELAKLDAGEEGDWVVGVLGAAASFTASFDHLGMARVLGRHFVLRDVSDLAERAAIDNAFASMTPSRRDEIYKRRKTHKRLAVFLHEWGHTLGALHVQNGKSLLNPTYDDSMEAFDDGNHGLLDASLRDLFRYAGTHDELKAYLSGSGGAGLPAEGRGELLAQLEQPTAPSQAALAAAPSSGALPEHPCLAPGSEEELLSGWEPADRAGYRQAATLIVAGDTVAALETAKPLGERHPTNYAVNHLLCSAAMQLGDQASAEQACPRAIAAASTTK